MDFELSIIFLKSSRVLLQNYVLVEMCLFVSMCVYFS